jgi:hypothetical protein
MSTVVAMSFSVVVSSMAVMSSSTAAPVKSDFHPTLAVSNIKNSILFVLEMDKDHYTM